MYHIISAIAIFFGYSPLLWYYIEGITLKKDIGTGIIMINFVRKAGAVFFATALTVASLSGCASKDKTAVEETAGGFLAVVASDSTEDINKYATMEVAGGDFVQLFDADSMTDAFVSGFDLSELTDETKKEVDSFCQLFDDMIKEYSVTKVDIGKDGTATAIATIKTNFPVDIINSESASVKISEATEAYNKNNEEEIAAWYEEGEEYAKAKIYDDMIRIILEIYEDEIANSSEENYAIALTLEKNKDTGSWLVTDVNDYDSSTGED